MKLLSHVAAAAWLALLASCGSTTPPLGDVSKYGQLVVPGHPKQYVVHVLGRPTEASSNRDGERWTYLGTDGSVLSVLFDENDRVRKAKAGKRRGKRPS
ncbi:MAG: hypothetical protein AAF581_10400 [Planctomycetota bacterium]